jgi:hypothetical protein
MGYLLSSVDPVLYCDTNRPTHAPTVLSLAPLNDSVFDSALGSSRVVRFLVCFTGGTFTLCALHTAAAVQFINCALLRSLI